MENVDDFQKSLHSSLWLFRSRYTNSFFRKMDYKLAHKAAREERTSQMGSGGQPFIHTAGPHPQRTSEEHIYR